jgi:hypothetical protein
MALTGAPLITIAGFWLLAATTLHAQQCNKVSQEFFYESKDYINCLGIKLQAEFKHLTKGSKPPPHIYVLQKRKEYTTYFNSPDSKCTPPPFNQTLREVMGLFGVPKLIKDEITPLLTKLLWKTAKNQRFSQCTTEYIRRSFLSYVRNCSQVNIPTKAKYTVVSSASIKDSEEELDTTPAVLDPFPTFTKHHNLKAAQAYLEDLVKAFVALGNCKEHHGIASYRKILKKITSNAEKDICSCAQASYHQCTAAYDRTCKAVNRCIEKIADDPEKALNLRLLQSKMTNCADKVQLKVKGLQREALKLFRHFVNLKKNKNSVEYKKFGDFVRGIVSSLFNGDFCNNCKTHSPVELAANKAVAALANAKKP